MNDEDLPKAYNPHEHEEGIYKIWEQSGFFNPDNLPDSKAGREAFCITMAPPNITGHTHVGHALENVLSDIIIRRKRMEGKKTLFLPGKDHASIGAQYVLEKKLKKEGQTRRSLGREKFLERMWEWMHECGSNIDQEIKRLGISADWSRIRFTMDDAYQHAVETVFVHYYKKGYIYRGKRVVNWCPRCKTTISDLEVEYVEEKSKLWHIKYPFVDNKKEHITVATTRPESMLGDAAVAVHPDDTRYKDLIGKKALLPIQNREIPIVADELVDKEFGTGAVKVTPSHDMTDYEIATHHDLPFFEVIDADGKMTQEAGDAYEGLTVKTCREKIVSDLNKLGLIEKEEDYTHNLAICERCDSTIEPRLSDQWFLSMKELAQQARQAVQENKMKFIPPQRKDIFLKWLDGVRDWNISRQLWWGHQIPAWHCGCVNNPKWEIGHSQPAKKCASCKKEWEQTMDVLDTWFSSALWPFATLGWPEKTKDLKIYYPTSLISSAREIFYIWIVRMTFSGLEFMNEVPFKTVLTHGTILDKRGRKMSKSKGNVVDPMKLIEKYGIDATRFGLVWQAMGTQDIHWSEDPLIAGRKFLNKIWNSGRFALMNIGPEEQRVVKPRLTQPHTKQAVERLELTSNLADKHLEKLEFGQALHVLYDFYWHYFCDVYLEEMKKHNDEESRQTLFYVLASSLKQLNPFIPFITEHIWSILPIENKNLLIIEKTWKI